MTTEKLNILVTVGAGFIGSHLVDTLVEKGHRVGVLDSLVEQANLLALETDKGDYESINIGTGRAFTVREIAETLAAGLGKEIAPEISEKYREGDIRHCSADITKARNLLGYEPKVSLEDGLNELLEWVRNQTPDDKVATATTELAARNLVK